LGRNEREEGHQNEVFLQPSLLVRFHTLSLDRGKNLEAENQEERRVYSEEGEARRVLFGDEGLLSFLTTTF